MRSSDHQPFLLADMSIFQVINNPIDLKTIRKSIRANTYSSVDELMQDIELIFSNATTYNQEGSVIYNDAKTLLRLARKISRLQPKESLW